MYTLVALALSSRSPGADEARARAGRVPPPPPERVCEAFARPEPSLAGGAHRRSSTKPALLHTDEADVVDAVVFLAVGVGHAPVPGGVGIRVIRGRHVRAGAP